MHEHYADAIADPDPIRLAPDLVCLRFEVMKVRSALGAVRHLLDTGAVRPGDTAVDSSSGIYALALALACHRHGMRCHIVGSTTVDETLRVQLEILGATLEQMPPSADLKLDQHRRVERVRQLLLDNPGYHWMRQYHDDIHYAGYREVARHVDRMLPAGPLTIVGGVGTGASTGALAEYLRAGREVRLVGIQPFGSVTFEAGHTADPDMIIAGIGSSIEFRNVRHELYDRVHWVSFEYARAGAVALLRDRAIFAGLSSGAAYLAARWEREAGRTVVFVAPDTGTGTSARSSPATAKSRTPRASHRARWPARMRSCCRGRSPTGHPPRRCPPSASPPSHLDGRRDRRTGDRRRTGRRGACR